MLIAFQLSAIVQLVVDAFINTRFLLEVRLKSVTVGFLYFAIGLRNTPS